MTQPELKRVHRFWDVEACETPSSARTVRDTRLLESYTRHRLEAMWWIRETIPFEVAHGKDVLEIGCGNGVDGIVFAQQGSRYTGVDLTETAVEAARRHFEMMGLRAYFRPRTQRSWLWA